MKAELWQRVREVFELSLEATDVDVLIENECGDDLELRQAVLAMRAADAIADSLEPPLLTKPNPNPKRQVDVGEGDRVGEFMIQRELEQGGMGVVFEAEQNEPRRLVALKVLPADSEAPTLTQRVQSEAEILARLQHPGIATVYAAGVHTLPDGRGMPYLAMELVEGARNLIAFADEEQLSLKPRLDLFRQLCDAVNSAHQKGVIHRDLKPSNILVDANARVRVIDFGIAHLAGYSDGKLPSENCGGGVLGTPGYVSPERLLPGEDTNDVRSDIYSLGVVLAHVSGDKAPDELQWIVDKSTAEAPDDRYASAADLATDISRFLTHEPLLAGPTTAGYFARCFVRRHAAGVATATVLVLFLAAGLVGTTYGWREAKRQEWLARNESRRSGALRDVLRGLIVEASPQRQGPSVKLLEGLDRIVEDIEPAFAGQYDLQVIALCDVGHVQLEIGQWRRARKLLLRAVAIADEQLSDGYEKVLSLNLLGIAHQYLVESEQAIEVFRRALAIDGGLDPKVEEIRQDIEQNLAAELGRVGQLPESVRMLEQSYRSNGDRYGDNDVRTLASGNQLAEAYRTNARLDDAMVLSERLLAAWRSRDKDHVAAVRHLHNHGHLLQQFGRYEEALVLEREVLARWPKFIGKNHPHIATALQGAGIYALGTGDYVVAEQYFAKLLDHASMIKATPRQQALQPLSQVAKLLGYATRTKATPRQQALRPLLHASALVACGPEHFDAARKIFAVRLDGAAQYEGKSNMFISLARAAAARIALPSDDKQATAIAKQAYDELVKHSGADSWPARLGERWLRER